MIDPQVHSYFRSNWFQRDGAYVLVDGQYGSTGKGLLAALIAEACRGQIDLYTTNAGPNSGHTAYFKDEKIVLKQLPMGAVISKKMGVRPKVFLNGGAIIDMDVLDRELREHGVHTSDVIVHPSAAVIRNEEVQQDAANVSSIASTGQGIGPALIRKLRRESGSTFNHMSDPSRVRATLQDESVFVEVAQGFSLGVNSGFYPHVTTRECTVAQALADAGMPASSVRKVVMSVRTFPIRVGNTQGSSGPCYSDQKEIDWTTLGVEPEMTTVTKRVRRVFTFSRLQFMDAVYANAPDVIFVNFMNYLPPEIEKLSAWLDQNILDPYHTVMRRRPEALLLGFGPRSENVKMMWGL